MFESLLTPKQFDALAQMMRLREGSAREAAKLVFVEGKSTPDASREAGIPYPQGYTAVARVKEFLALAEILFTGKIK